MCLLAFLSFLVCVCAREGKKDRQKEGMEKRRGSVRGTRLASHSHLPPPVCISVLGHTHTLTSKACTLVVGSVI